MLQELKYSPYSPSKIGTFKQCPAKFEFQYIKKLPAPWTDTLATQRGALIHLLLEHSGDLQKVKASKDWADIQKIGILQKGHIKDCVRVYQDFTSSKEGQSILAKKRLFSEVPVGLDLGMEFTTFDQYTRTEDQPKSLALRGYIDAGFVAKDKDGDVLILVDWKSSNKLKTYDWDQLLYYAVAMFKKTKVQSIILCYASVDFNKLQTKKLTIDNLDRYQNFVETEIMQIENETEFPKVTSGLCGWCPFEDTCKPHG
jgi:putative RecB family exonuclease